MKWQKVFLLLTLIVCSSVILGQNIKTSKKVQIFNADTYDISAGNPDTALAVFLWKYGVPEIEYWKHREEFIRWDLEHVKISKLLKALFSSDPNFNIRIRILEALRQEFLSYCRTEIQTTYQNYGSIIDEMEFHYLVKRRDSLVYLLIENALLNEKTGRTEREKLRKIANTFKIQKR